MEKPEKEEKTNGREDKEGMEKLEKKRKTNGREEEKKRDGKPGEKQKLERVAKKHE